MSDMNRTPVQQAEAISRFGFDRPPATPGADFPPLDDLFRHQMDNLDAHHECPEKRVKGRCRCVLND